MEDLGGQTWYLTDDNKVVHASKVRKGAEGIKAFACEGWAEWKSITEMPGWKAASKSEERMKA